MSEDGPWGKGPSKKRPSKQGGGGLYGGGGSDEGRSSSDEPRPDERREQRRSDERPYGKRSEEERDERSPDRLYGKKPDQRRDERRSQNRPSQDRPYGKKSDQRREERPPPDRLYGKKSDQRREQRRSDERPYGHRSDGRRSDRGRSERPDRGRSGGRRPPQRRGESSGPYGRRSEAPPRRREERPEPLGPPPAARLVEVDEIEVDIEKIVLGGDGLARWEGIPIFVPRSAPGDRLRVRLTERKADYGRAEIAEILTPGPDRREAPCPHYDACGGCDLQHLDEAAQLRAKAQAVRETLRRIGKIEFPKDVEILAGEPWGYRLRHQLQVGDTVRGRRVGYFSRGSHDLVPIDRCPILVPTLQTELRKWPRRIRDVEHKRLDVAAGDGGSWTCSPKLDSVPHGEISLTVECAQGEFSYLFDARCFFQGHRQLLPRLVDAVIDTQANDGKDGEVALDLFSGVGLFTLPLAKRYERVIAVESDRIAARWARKNAKQNRIQNIEIEATAAQSWIERIEAEFPDGVDRVIVDPPRGGLPAKVRQMLVRRPPRRLTYVSCHPATLARDLKALVGVFRIERLKLIDLFPQTGHMEVIVQLVREDAS